MIKHLLRSLFNNRGDFGGGDDKEGAEQGIQQVGQDIYNRGKQTPGEEAQYAGSFDLGNYLKQIYMSQLGLGQAPTGYQQPTQQYLGQTGDLGQAYYNQTLQGVQDPNMLYESTLQPQLALVSDYINNQYNTRGLMGSGLNIEQMGRAGAELAVAEANARMQNRQQQLSNASSLISNINQLSQQNLSNASGLYAQQQQSGLQSMSRQAGQAQAAGQYSAYPYQAQLGNYYGGQAAMQALPGQLIGAAGQLGASYLGAPKTTNYLGY